MPSPLKSPVLLVKDLGGLALYYPGQALVSRAPRSLLGHAARVGGDLVRKVSKAERREALEELEALFGDQPMPHYKCEILREAYRQTMFNELEVLRYPHLDPQSVDEVCVVEGREHLDAALARGKGAIVLIGHFGANQMIMPALGHAGYPMNQLSAPPPVWADILRETRTTPLWEKVLERRWELEQRLPVRHINVFKFLRPALECLQNNEVLGLAFDGGGGRRWTQVQFMARRANVAVQPAQLARKTGAAILPTAVIREPGERRHRIVIHAPLELEWTRDRSADLQRAMQAYVDVFATWVAEHPAHYLNFMLLRRKVRATDVVPFFDDSPPAPGQMDAKQAQEHLQWAGRKFEESGA
ncbi:MAG: lysophospholipid acyltransferase family protein [Myxococcota bacterium]|nr:lysophospholipid acyltransferase family protein [Myxococcota bacterium]